MEDAMSSARARKRVRAVFFFDGSMHRLFRRRDPGDHGLGETIDPRPVAVTDAVLVGGDVDQGAARLRLGHLVVALLVGEDDQAIALAVDLADSLAEPGPAMRLRTDDRIAQREAAAGRDLHDPVGEREDLHLIANLASEDGETAGRLGARHLRLRREGSEHRSRHVDQQPRATRESCVTLDRLQHRGFELGLEIRRVTRRRDEAVGKDAVRPHRLDGVGDGPARHLRLLHQAQVAEQRQPAQPLLGHQPLESLALVLAGRERHLPGVGRSKLAVDELLPHLLLGLVLRLGVDEEQHVPDPHRAVAVVLRELIGVELGKCPRQALLDLRRDGLPLALLLGTERVGPVDRKQLRHLVGTLDHPLQRVGDEGAVLLVPRHLADDEQRRMPQLHHLARLDGECRDPLGVDLRHQRLDAVGDGDAVLIELILPEEAVHQRALQLHLGRETLAACALMGESANDLVEPDHDGLLSGLSVNGKGCRGTGEADLPFRASRALPLSYGLASGRTRTSDRAMYEVTALFTTGVLGDTAREQAIAETPTGLHRPGSALPLSYRRMERRAGFEPATSRFGDEVTAIFTTGRGWDWRGTGDTVAAPKSTSATASLPAGFEPASPTASAAGALPK